MFHPFFTYFELYAGNKKRALKKLKKEPYGYTADKKQAKLQVQPCGKHINDRKLGGFFPL
jgi:hypothetical protein